MQGRPAAPPPWIEHGLDRRVVMQAMDPGPFPDLPPGPSVEYDMAVLELDKRIGRAVGLCNVEVSYRCRMAPRIRNDAIQLPWIFHSDGNLMDMLDNLVPLGMSGWRSKP